MLKIVIDTNVVIDASEDYFRYANRIIDLVIAGQVEAYANHATLAENKLLARRKIQDPGYLKKLEYFFEVVKPIQTSITKQVIEDREDEKILASALSAHADFLITSDNHLLKLEKIKHTKIVRPNEFWSEYEDEGEGWMKWIKNFIAPEA
ncbi:MAG TPA: putative toxin-antitoxin system toxin component, PIN family [Methylomirabilota bacterium]|jgi:putative PIN family toxin of toxin-antitoxin system|nr:putative toxin-antitoxin system toxin component, PIN family [Methylomirabilota bacterium]